MGSLIGLGHSAVLSISFHTNNKLKNSALVRYYKFDTINSKIMERNLRKPPKSH